MFRYLIAVLEGNILGTKTSELSLACSYIYRFIVVFFANITDLYLTVLLYRNLYNLFDRRQFLDFTAIQTHNILFI